MRIGFLGYGEAACAFHEGLARPGLAVCAHDRLLCGEAGDAMRATMRRQGAEIAETVAELASCDWIFSAVTADQSFAAVEALAPALRQGQVVIDINSVSPERKQQTAALVMAKSAEYLDMAVMAPVYPKKHATPVLIAGPMAAALLEPLTALGFSVEIAGEAVGAATAIKMVRSLFVKGLEAITVEALLAAEASGCCEAVYASLSASFPGLGWPEFAHYQLERTLRHGHRRAAEMEESAATLFQLHLAGGLAKAIADVQRQMGECGPQQQGEDLRATLKAVLARRGV
ncbi:3-hydroxyisobutyrate dehydrogenase-like beta-hydroxyacid dehydrogenase [Neorhizobium galegae]|uniref:NAD(P)-dependent oxidoreductase n=1 Tax=Neorhizobium galegae TaxID=399 RepID=UPI001AE3CE94|nr:NAD(P)-dependent oxidoreductase [Neorhizobium galegae]MBP2547958.1 3-hydroxyisobutyrate dehydrogenase-like beta-hydroxyacid dehydrogenase [Neorhizobium galegae]